MAKKKKAKKGLPPKLKAWNVCRTRSGIKPGQTGTAKQKREAEACVDQIMKDDE